MCSFLESRSSQPWNPAPGTSQTSGKNSTPVGRATGPLAAHCAHLLLSSPWGQSVPLRLPEPRTRSPRAVNRAP